MIPRALITAPGSPNNNTVEPLTMENDPQAYVDQITLSFSHAMVMGHCPQSVDLSLVAKKMSIEAKSVESLGFWDSASANFSDYYPEVKAEDLKPELDQTTFIFPVFRGLSETIVHRNWNPVDFSKPGVLKASMKLLKAQTVYPNHTMEVGLELGTVFEVAWQEAYKTSDGKEVPAGINTRLKLDGKANPKIARGIMMEPPSIHSVSVTVSFEWEPSHTFTDMNEFWSKLGTYHSDGTLIRRIATKIKAYHEISLVPHGADPFAQRVNDKGEIINPTYADLMSNKAEMAPKQKRFHYDYGIDTVSNSETTPTIPNHNPLKPQPAKEMNKSLIALAALFGLTHTEGQTEEAFSALIQERVQASLAAAQEKPTLDQSIASLKADKTRLEGQVTDLTTQLGAAPKKEDYDRFKAAHDKSLAEEKASSVELLNKIHNNTPAQALVDAVNNSTNLDAVKAMKSAYEIQLNSQAPLKCQKCHSTDVSRASAAPNPPKGDTPTHTGDVNKTAMQFGAQKPKLSIFDEEA